jgi:hypothetical protein
MPPPICVHLAAADPIPRPVRNAPMIIVADIESGPLNRLSSRCQAI